MASAPKTISQRIALEGAEEIKRLLEQIGQAGAKAFEQLSAATSAATKNLEGISRAVAVVEAEVKKVAEAGRNFGTALGNLGGSVNNFGGAVGDMAARVALIGAAALAAGTAIAAIGINAVKAADNLGEQAAAIGLNVERYQELQFAAAQAGVSQEQFSGGIARFSRQVADAAQESAKGLATFAEATRAGAQRAGFHVIEAGRKFVEEFRVIGEAAKRLQAELAARGIERPLFRIREELQKLADGNAQARRQFEQLTGQALPAASAGLERLRLQAEGGGNALRRLGIQVTRNADGSVDFEKVLGALADRFQKMPEGAEKTALAMELFGRSAGPKLVPFLSQGREGIAALTDELRKMGILLTRDEVAAADKAANALDLLGLAAQNARTKIGLVFAPLIESGASTLTKLIADSQQALLSFAQTIERQVSPFVDAFFKLLRGEGDDDNQALQTLAELKDRAVAFGTAVKNAVTGVIVPAFNALMAMLGRVAQAINAVFGTTLTAEQLGIAIVVAQLIGAFSVLGAAVGVVVAALGVLAAAFAVLATPIGLAIGVITALVALLILLPQRWEQIKATAVEAWEQIKAKANETREAIRAFLTQQVDGAWRWVVETFDGVVATVKQKTQEMVDAVASIVQNAPIVGPIIASIERLLALIEQLKGQQLPGNLQQPQGVPFGQFPTGPQTQDPSGGMFPGGRLSDNVEDHRQTTAMVEAFRLAVEQIKALIEEAKTAVAVFVAQTAEQISFSFSLVGPAVDAAMASAAASIASASANIAQALLAPFQAAAQGIQSIWDGVSTFVLTGFATLQSSIASVETQIQETITRIISALQAAAQAAQSLAAAAAGGGGGGGGENGGGGGSGFAGGGQVFGPGTATSDSILARLSRGEFVIRAAAVQHYGPALMAALNSMRLPKDFLRGFNVGGMVENFNRSMAALAVPRFAMGGLANAIPAASGGGGMAAFNLVIDGRPYPVMAQANTVDELQRYAVAAQVRRAGRRPRGG